MFRKLVIIGIILGLAGSASAIKYVGNPNAGNGWDTTSAVTAKDPLSLGFASVDEIWTQTHPTPGVKVIVDGNGINPSNKDQHSTAEYPGAYTGCPPSPCTTYPTWHACRAPRYTGGGTCPTYDSDMDAAGQMWFAFEFDTTHYVADMEVWNYNGFPGDCLPEGTQSPCQWKTRNYYGVKDWRISYSIDQVHWRETKNGSAAKGTALTLGPQEGWNWTDDAQYPDIITIDANAHYVVLTAINSYQPGTSVGIGEARFETDPNRATKPHKNGGDKFMNMPLRWKKGFDASIAKHKVYLSTSEAAVDARTAPNTVVTSPTYDWPGLAHGWETGVDYYWAVDELNSSDVVVGEGTGRTWSFSNISLGLVDDYESYEVNGTDMSDLWAVYHDGYVSNPLETHPSGAAVEQAFFEYGLQGLKIMYDNDGTWSHADYPPYTAIDVNYSEVWVETDDLISSSRDLTNGGVTASIRTWVMGPNTNDANEQVYIQLEDGDGNTAKVQYLPATHMGDGTWHEWRIALSDFTGVDVTDVNVISIIVGDETGPPSGTGNGTIYFDDFRLQPPECGIMGEVDPTLAQGDLNEDCIVDWKDLAILVDNWLDSGTSP